MHTLMRARQENTVLIAGSFDTEGAGAVVASTSAGKGYTYSKPAGTGIYRVTFNSDGTRKYPRILSVVASVEDGSESTVTVRNSVASNGYVEFTVYTAGVAADLTSGTIHFIIVAQDSSVGTA